MNQQSTDPNESTAELNGPSALEAEAQGQVGGEYVLEPFALE